MTLVACSTIKMKDERERESTELYECIKWKFGLHLEDDDDDDDGSDEINHQAREDFAFCKLMLYCNRFEIF